jgi:hypothetical protein
MPQNQESPVLSGLFFDPKVVLLLVLMLGLQGCLSSSSGSVLRTVTAYVDDRRPQILTDEEINALGFGVLEVSIDGRAPISMIFGGLDSRSYTLSFYSQDRARLDMINGQVVRSRGFAVDVLERRPIGLNPFAVGLHKIESLRTFFWKVSLSNGARGLIAESRYELGNESTIVISGKSVSVTEMIEYWEIPELGFKARNVFLYDDEGIVVATRQSVNADTPRFETTLRSYRSR